MKCTKRKLIYERCHQSYIFFLNCSVTLKFSPFFKCMYKWFHLTLNLKRCIYTIMNLLLKSKSFLPQKIISNITNITIPSNMSKGHFAFSNFLKMTTFHERSITSWNEQASWFFIRKNAGDSDNSNSREQRENAKSKQTRKQNLQCCKKDFLTNKSTFHSTLHFIAYYTYYSILLVY